MKSINKFALLLFLFSIAFQVSAQENNNPAPIIFIYDASGSMWGQLEGKTKMKIAADVLTNSVNNLPENQKVGLVAYGHRTKGDCEDVEFLVDLHNMEKSKVNQAIKAIKPLGKTPLAKSALQVINKLRDSKEKATIILVTDGIESCNGNICDVINAAKAEGIEFKLHIIGFGIKEEDTQQLKCAAEAGEGNYYDANDTNGLTDVLNDATTTRIDDPEGNVSVYATMNGIAIDALVKAYDVDGKQESITVRTYQDTAYFYLPPNKYYFEVRPLEGSDVNMVTISNIQSYEDQIVHQTISFDAGKLQIATTNNGANWDCLVKIKDQNDKLVTSARTYQNPKEVEVNPGSYKVTIQALTMEGMETYTEIENVIISSGKTTAISADFETGNFQIYTKVGGQDIDCIVTLKEINSGKSVAGSRTYDRGTNFLLNPGIYEVKAVPLGDHKSKKAQILTIEIKKGETVTKELNY